MEYNIYGKISFNVDFDIEASSENEAILKAKESILDYYHLSVGNAYHDSNKVIFDLDAGEYEE